MTDAPPPPEPTFADDREASRWWLEHVYAGDDAVQLPKISLTADTIAAAENPVHAANFTIARTGPVTAALTVSLNYTGTATSGTDYAALPATVTISAGATTATVALTPINDTVAEDFETVIVTLATNAAYIVDPAARIGNWQYYYTQYYYY